MECKDNTHSAKAARIQRRIDEKIGFPLDSPLFVIHLRIRGLRQDIVQFKEYLSEQQIDAIKIHIEKLESVIAERR